MNVSCNRIYWHRQYGSALARAADKGAAPGARLYLSNRTPAKAEALCNQLSRAQMSDNQEIARSCDTIFLGVKPQMMAAALKDLVPVLGRPDRPFRGGQYGGRTDL